MKKQQKLLWLTNAGLVVFRGPEYPRAVIAQEGFQIEEGIVTAQRRAQNLQDAPMSISAFSAADIEKNMFKGVGDYVTATPNASFISNGSKAK